MLSMKIERHVYNNICVDFMGTILTSSLQPPLQPWDLHPVALVQQLTICCGDKASVAVCEIPPTLIRYMLSITSAAANAQQEPGRDMRKDRRYFEEHEYMIIYLFI